MRDAIIDTTRTITVESDIVEIDGIDREIWCVVERCPVYGVDVWPEYYASKAEALAALNVVLPSHAMTAAHIRQQFLPLLQGAAQELRALL